MGRTSLGIPDQLCFRSSSVTSWRQTEPHEVNIEFDSTEIRRSELSWMMAGQEDFESGSQDHQKKISTSNNWAEHSSSYRCM